MSWSRKASCARARIAFARKVIDEKLPLRRMRDLNDKIEAARGKPEIFDEFRKANARKFRGFEAPEVQHPRGRGRGRICPSTKA